MSIQEFQTYVGLLPGRDRPDLEAVRLLGRRIGREGGTWSFDFYCDVKNVAIRKNSFA